MDFFQFLLLIFLKGKIYRGVIKLYKTVHGLLWSAKACTNLNVNELNIERESSPVVDNGDRAKEI